MSRTSIRVLIVDDEPPARRRLGNLLEAKEEIEVVGECGSGAEAVAAIGERRPDLVFLDVQMPRMNGFEVIRRIRTAGVALPAIVFVTAYDQFAVRAFEVNAVDYLVKPFSRERFDEAVERARASILRSPGPRRKYAKRILVRDNGTTTVVRTADIEWVEAASNYVKLHAGAKAHVARGSLSRVEAQLDPLSFVRIHRSALVNVAHVEELIPLFNRDHLVRLRSGVKLVASRTHFDALIAALTKH